MRLPFFNWPTQGHPQQAGADRGADQCAASISWIEASAIGSPWRWANSRTARAAEVLHKSAIVGCSSASSSSSLIQTASAMSKLELPVRASMPGNSLRFRLLGTLPLSSFPARWR